MMKLPVVLPLVLLLFAVPVSAELPQLDDESYRQGRRALDESRYEEAIRHFNAAKARAEESGVDGVDAALYWLAYAHHRAGDGGDALRRLAELDSGFPESRWRDDAQALRMEIQGRGEAVDESEALKLLALNGLMHSESERAVATLERYLAEDRSPRLHDKALFVLSQSPSPRARDLLLGAARGERGEELQVRALRYVGMVDDVDAAVLDEIYAGGSLEVKNRVLQAFMVRGQKDRILGVLRREEAPELRRTAIRHLGMVGAVEELRELYTAPQMAEHRGHVLEGLFMADAVDALVEIVRREEDPELRRAAIHSLGRTGSEEAQPLLVEIYRGESDAAVKQAVIEAFFFSDNAAQLVEIARTESDLELRRAAVQWLGRSDSEEALEYLMSLLEDQ